MKDIKEHIININIKNLLKYVTEARVAKKYEIPSYINAGPELLQNIDLIKKIDKMFFQMKGFLLKNLEGEYVNDTNWNGEREFKVLNVEVDENNKTITLNNISKVICNIDSGLKKFNEYKFGLYGYRILLPEGSVLVVRDSSSKSRSLLAFKNAILDVFSKDNKFEAISLVYISLDNCSLDEDFLTDIYTNNLSLHNAKGIRTISTDSSKYANPKCNVDAEGKKTFKATVDASQQKADMKKQQEEAKKELEKNARGIAEQMLDELLDNNDSNFKGTKEDKDKFINFYTKQLVENNIKSFEQLDGPYYYMSRSKDRDKTSGEWNPYQDSYYDIIDYSTYHFEKDYSSDCTTWRGNPSFDTDINGEYMSTCVIWSYRTLGIMFDFHPAKGKSEDEYLAFWYEYTYNGKKLKKPNYNEIW